jgi:alkylated DNA repair dioxygenase AlkB
MTTKTIKLSENSHMIVYTGAIVISKTEFDEFWNEKPTERHKIMMYGSLVDCPRYQAVYGHGPGYKFSGTLLKAQEGPMPDIVNRCIEVSRELYPDFNWNGALVNWYPDGSSYIGSHSDDEKDLVSGAPILSFSFGETRIFRIRKKIGPGPGTGQDRPAGPAMGPIDIETLHGSMIAMCGSMQKEFKHEIVKTSRPKGPRINVTVRCFIV